MIIVRQNKDEHIRGQEQNATSELWKVNLATRIWTLTLSYSLSLHLLSSNFVLIHLIISSIILPPPSHPSAPHDCLFIYPFTSPLSHHSLPNTMLATLLFVLPIYQPVLFFSLSLSVSYPLFTLRFPLLAFVIRHILTGTFSLLFAWAAAAPWARALPLTSQVRVSCCITPPTTASPGRCCSTTLTKASTSQGMFRECVCVCVWTRCASARTPL